MGWLTSLPAAALSTAAGMIGVAAVVYFRWKLRRWSTMSLTTVLATFLTTSALPTAILFFLFPFLEPKPDLSSHSIYMPLAGFGLVSTIFLSVKQGIGSSSETIQSSATPGPDDRSA
jgi:hypothetical protein